MDTQAKSCSCAAWSHKLFSSSSLEGIKKEKREKRLKISSVTITWHQMNWGIQIM